MWCDPCGGGGLSLSLVAAEPASSSSGGSRQPRERSRSPLARSVGDDVPEISLMLEDERLTDIGKCTLLLLLPPSGRLWGTLRLAGSACWEGLLSRDVGHCSAGRGGLPLSLWGGCIHSTWEL